ncbi:hypothetical protein GQ53DRAFT_815178 [Thozetella sp. PMI_491]|nr:hypothetical protein GQ53DRAFT_815178 [Thozetella sp. PMI_491]
MSDTTVKLVLFIYRKSNISTAHFRKHYEEIHIPKMKQLFGENFPQTHVRRYVPRQNDIANSPKSTTPEMDCITELTFRDQQHFKDFMAISSIESVAGEIGTDCADFMDTSRPTPTFVVDKYVESSL